MPATPVAPSPAAHSCVLVCIPCDASAPMREERVAYDGPDTESEISCVTQYVKKALSMQAGAATRVDSDEFKAAMAAQAGESAVSSITPEMATQLAGMNMVETITLLPGGPHNGFEHWNLYGDDKSALKGLPRNARAEGLLLACGAPAASVHGDVYAGRVVDCEEAFERRDFLIADMDSNAPWVALAKEVNGRRAAGGAGAAEARVKAALGDAGANAQFGSVTAPGGAGLGSEATGGAVGAATWRDADDGELELRVRLPEGPLRERGAAKLLNVSLKRGGKELLVTAKGVEVPLVTASPLYKAASTDEMTWFLDKETSELIIGLTATDGGNWGGNLVAGGGSVEAPEAAQ